MAITSLTCRECGTEYALEARYVCEHCFGPLEVAYDHSGLDPAETRRKIQAGPTGIWRYADFLPFSERPKDPLQPGLTPLIRADRLAERLGIGEVWIKNDAANPTHSFKDRVVAVAIAKARELGFDTVACASTGNLANAVAAHAAAAGLDSYVFVPADLEEQKLLATGVYGTKLVGVEGSYDDVNRLCTELAETRPWAFVNVNLRPYYAQGSKTLAYETVEQLGWSLPDRIVCPIASGSLFTKIGKGLSEWIELGLVEGDLPAFNGAQAEGCSPVAEAYAAGWDACKRHPVAGRDDGDLHRDRGWRDHGGAGEARRGRRDRQRRARGGDHHRRGPEDARRGPRGLRDLDDRADGGVVRGRGRRRPRRGVADTAALDFAAMAVTVKIPAQLRGVTGGEGELEVEGSTVGEALDAVFDAHSDLRERITEDGTLRRFVNVYVSGEDIRFQEGLDTELSDGDEVTILPAVAGGL
jgi:threonine synthase